MSDDERIEEQIAGEPFAPPNTYTIWTLDPATGNARTQVGGASDQPSACSLAAVIAQTVRVGVGVYNNTPSLVAYIKQAQTTTPP